MFLPRALAYQAPENPNQRRAAVKSLRELPETPLFEDFLEAARTWCPKLAQAFAQPPAKGWRNRSMNRWRNRSGTVGRTVANR